MEIMKRGIRIKRCALCDRYFILVDNRKRDYCDRPYKGKRTSKQIRAKKKFNQSVGDDIYLLQFQTIYNRMYSRYHRMNSWESDRSTNKLTEEQFKAWISEASKARKEYKSGAISGDELVKRISEEAMRKIWRIIFMPQGDQYLDFTNYLKLQHAENNNRFTMTFSEIEAVLRFTLSSSCMK